MNKLYKYVSLNEALATIQTNCLRKNKINLKRKHNYEIYHKMLDIPVENNGLIIFSKLENYDFKDTQIVQGDISLCFECDKDKLVKDYRITTIDIRNAIETYYHKSNYIEKEDKYIEYLWIDSEEEGIINFNKYVDCAIYHGIGEGMRNYSILSRESMRNRRYEMNKGEFGIEIDDFIFNLFEKANIDIYKTNVNKNDIFIELFENICNHYNFNYKIKKY